VAPTQYEIVVRGRVGSVLGQSLGGFEVTEAGADGTHLRGWVCDRAALQGLLNQISDVGLELTSVRQLNVSS
jgi:hypothetical protein